MIGVNEARKLLGNSVEMQQATLGALIPHERRVAFQLEALVACLRNEQSSKPSASITRQQRSYLELAIEFSQDPTNQEAILYQLKLIKNFSKFSEAVRTFKAVNDHPEESVEFISQGRMANAYKLTLDGEEYAVRILRTDPNLFSGYEDYDIPAYSISDYFSGSFIVEGNHHIEQIVAVSYEENATVAKFISGKPIYKLVGKELEGLSIQQIISYLESVVPVIQKGICFDTGSSNFRYDSIKGISVLDFSYSPNIVRSETNAFGVASSGLLSEFRNIAAVDPQITKAKSRALEMINTIKLSSLSLY